MTIENYIQSVSTRLKSGISREHSYRGDLETLIRELVTDVEITNEPANVTDCGNPDYVITKGKVPIGYIEAKDIGKDLNSKTFKEQFDRYKKALDNLIITDYIWFQFFQEGELVHEIRIAEIVENDIGGNTVTPLPENFAQFTNLIQDFCTHIGQTIKSSKKLAKMMAGKAKLLQNILQQAITSDEQSQENTSLKEQYETFKSLLIHDLTPTGFADIYAQTLAYGMFAARLHDTTLDDFSRQEAAELIPKSNPFLRRLFSYVAGPDIDERIMTTVDNLADVFRATNVDALLHNFGKSTQSQDPIIHFYEDFLSEYDPKLRKARGVWYTPEPVVKFIVRAVDDILKTEFNLPQGLADTSKTTIKVDSQIPDKRSATGYKQMEKQVHKVQIIDPATGTGTFLAEVVKYIYSKNFKAMQGAWSGYVEEHLIPRLNGFELLMASYSMAHLKLDMLLTETGYKSTKNQRFNIYLTNSLEEHHPDTGTIFSSWLSTEANEANHIKRDTPVMVIMGNPPYSGESANKGKWIMNLMEDYKKEPGGKEKLKERNPKWINDDYVKFLRYGQYYIERNGEGILAFINPHGFLDNPTFRGMRWNLLKTYDKIYTIDLHGNSKKKEVCPDGSPDTNVFDIMQGVAITVFVKTGKKKANELGKVFHYDLYGKRDFKYDFLLNNSLTTIEFKTIIPVKNNFIFKYVDEEVLNKYNKGIKPTDLFNINVMGFQTHRDKFAISENKNSINSRALDLRDLNQTNENIYSKYLIKDNRDWQLTKARKNIQNDSSWKEKIIKCSYRPFDDKYCYFSYVMMDYPRKELIQNVLDKENILLGIGRQGLAVGNIEWCLTTVSRDPVDANVFRRGGVNLFPLYLYPENDNQQSSNQSIERIPNLNKEIVKEIAKKLNLTFTSEKETTQNTFAPIDILDYIYAVLHSPTYRDKYKEFLKIDFPRVPYPKDAKTFWQLVKLGGEIRQIHLLESPKVEQYISSYPIDGDNNITRKLTKTSIGYQATTDTHGKVWINDTQYFDNVPLISWEFYIGGYQPAQKWLKDRKTRELKFEDILHYQKIIVALFETHRIMQEIDKIEVE